MKVDVRSKDAKESLRVGSRLNARARRVEPPGSAALFEQEVRIARRLVSWPILRVLQSPVW